MSEQCLRCESTLQPAEAGYCDPCEGALRADKNGWTGRPCPDCMGTGETNLDWPRSCPACGGTGEENIG